MAVIETSSRQNQPGVYKHPDTGATVELEAHPQFGTAIIDGFVSAGYVFQGPAKEQKQESKKEGK